MLKRLFSKALGCNNLSSYTRTTFLQSNHPQSPSLSSTTPPPSNFLTCSTSASMADPSTSTLKRPTPEVTDIESKEPDSKRYKYVDETDKGVVKEGGGTQAGEDRAGKKEKKNFKDESRKAAREFHASHKKRRGTRPEGEARVDDGEPKAPRQPKRHCALLIGFCGAGYNGMQIQPNVRTIEGTLFSALVKAGAVSKDNADDHAKVNLSRAARTDAGVHAAGNIVSIKLITSVPGVPDMVARINEELPPEIRLWNFIRVQNSFNARTSCDSRKYTYYFPSYLLIPSKPGSGLYKTLSEQAGTSDEPPHPFWADTPPDSTREDDLQKKRQWRVPPEYMEALRSVGKKYEGSHNFHNFTVGKDFGDRSTSRFMKSIEITDPVVHGGTEWISVLFHGQSFMLHQRKMMAALVLIARTNTPAEIIEELYGPRTLFIPKMPALGLLLEYPIFGTYNWRVENTNKGLKSSDENYRPLIDFEVHRENIEKFKQEHIYSRMRTIEDRDGVFDAWMRSVDSYIGNDLLYLNPKAVVPTTAVIKRGERRDNPFRERKKFDATTFPGGEAKMLYAEEEEEEEEEIFDKKMLADMEG